MDSKANLAALLHHLFSAPDTPRVPAPQPSVTPPVVDAPLPPLGPQPLARVIEEANAELALRQTGLRFVQQDAYPRPIIQIVDQASGEVLRQIPNEAAVRMAQALTGLLVDDRA